MYRFQVAGQMSSGLAVTFEPPPRRQRPRASIAALPALRCKL